MKRRNLMAAVVMGAALTSLASAPPAQAGEDTINNISRYCATCWRNARIGQDNWTDCTQEVFIRLLERVDPAKWETVLKNEDNLERKEFLRAIDAVKKRSKRARTYQALAMEPGDYRPVIEQERNDLRKELDDKSQSLSQRQRQILNLTGDGWGVDEIAVEMKTTAARVSDEKYKAIRKLRSTIQA